MQRPATKSSVNEAATAAHNRIGRLKWLTTIVPALAVFGYETVRHSLLEPLLPEAWGNLIAGLVALVFAYAFSELVFGLVERLQAEMLERSCEVAELGAIVGERERLSRELHDGLAQVIAYLLLRIDTVESLVNDGRGGDATAELEQLRSSASDLYVDVRDSISGLRAQVIENGLQPALAEYLRQFQERHGIEVAFRCAALPSDCSPLIQLQLFRIVQEALTNIRRHAQAQHATVSVDALRNEQLQLTIEDDGIGFDVGAIAGHQIAEHQIAEHHEEAVGLASMRERAEALGGSFRIASRPGGPTQVVVVTPLRSRTVDRQVAHASAAG